ncbi:MAG: GNAT family N-acetyltransferase [Deltaproteobacteria bacterium]|nr:MAG: GNAT family N-acetyltransferase [Deltaproteobacteria bacterium]
MIQKVVYFSPESVAALIRNQWQVYSGMGGRFEPESTVKPEYRKKGIAKELINRCLDALMGIGILKTHIDVFKRNDDANSYWEKNGWVLREDINRYSCIRSNNPNV